MAKFVQYIGTSHVRQITTEDWSKVGVKHNTVSWERRNNWLVPLKNISDDAWPFVDADPELVLVDRLAKDKPNDPDEADMAAANASGYLASLRQPDATDTVTGEDTTSASDGAGTGQAPGSSTGNTGSSS